MWCCVQTPLCLAVITNQPSLVEKLLQLGSDAGVQIVTERGQHMQSRREQLIHVAASRGRASLDTLRVLLRYRQHVDIDVMNSEGLLSSLHPPGAVVIKRVCLLPPQTVVCERLMIRCAFFPYCVFFVCLESRFSAVAQPIATKLGPRPTHSVEQ